MRDVVHQLLSLLTKDVSIGTSIQALQSSIDELIKAKDRLVLYPQNFEEDCLKHGEIVSQHMPKIKITRKMFYSQENKIFLKALKGPSK